MNIKKILLVGLFAIPFIGFSGEVRGLPFVVDKRTVFEESTIECSVGYINTFTLKGHTWVEGNVFVVQTKDGLTVVGVDNCVVRVSE